MPKIPTSVLTDGGSGRVTGTENADASSTAAGRWSPRMMLMFSVKLDILDLGWRRLTILVSTTSRVGFKVTNQNLR